MFWNKKPHAHKDLEQRIQTLSELQIKIAEEHTKEIENLHAYIKGFVQGYNQRLAGLESIVTTLNQPKVAPKPQPKATSNVPAENKKPQTKPRAKGRPRLPDSIDPTVMKRRVDARKLYAQKTNKK